MRIFGKLSAVLRLGLPACCAWLLACSQLPQTPAVHHIGGLRLLGEQRIALDQPFKGTRIGGLSGIDYDPKTDTWVSESDDRSEINPARFYVLRLHYDLQGFHELTVQDVTFLRQPDGTLYPGVVEVAQRAGDIPDLESVRIDPSDGSVW